MDPNTPAQIQTPNRFSAIRIPLLTFFCIVGSITILYFLYTKYGDTLPLNPLSQKKIIKPTLVESDTSSNKYFDATVSVDVKTQTVTLENNTTVKEIPPPLLSNKPKGIAGDFIYKMTIHNTDGALLAEGWNLIAKESIAINNNKATFHITTKNQKGNIIRLTSPDNQIFFTHKI